MSYTCISGLGFVPCASVSVPPIRVRPVSPLSSAGRRRRRLPPRVERIFRDVILPFFHESSSMTKPPRQRRPLTVPWLFHTVGSAGSRCTQPSWLCTSISAMPAQQPKLPSIWNGGCASNILVYVPPSWSRMVQLGLFRCSWFFISVMAWSPSSWRAHWHTFHPMDHPRLASPRPMSDFFTAWNSSGCSYGDT